MIATDPTFKVEVSFEEAVTLLGVPGMFIGTYTSGPKPDGSLGGYGEGVILTNESDLITWTGVGAGRSSAGGAVSYRGAICYTTASPKFARLNSVAGAFYFEIDAAGNTQSKIWEWK